jgi:Family of unknown function (DUF6152)
MKSFPAVWVLGLMLAAAPLLEAHHSAVAEYGAKLLTLNAIITKFDWINPHTWLYFDVMGANGAVTKWEAEGSAPSGLLDNGWRKDSLKPGDRVTIECYPAKDRANLCKTRAVTLANGRRLVMGAP